MKLLNRLRRRRPLDLQHTVVLTLALKAEAERLFPGADADRFDGTPRVCGVGACDNPALPGRAFCRECHEVIFGCEPIPCDIEDNYICARHANG